MQKYTAEQVKEKMASLGVFGYSSMGEFEPDDVMARLQDLDKMFSEQKSQLTAYKNTRSQLKGSKDASTDSITPRENHVAH